MALEGTKAAANAALDADRSYEAIEEDVRRILPDTKALDADEDALYGPDRRVDRLQRMQEAKARLQREATEAAQAAQEHQARRQADEAATVKKKRGRKPREVEPTPAEETKANVIDPGRRVMKTRHGYVEDYNVHAVVSADQVIVAVGVTQEANDKHQVLAMLEKLNENLGAARIEDRPRVVLGDAGIGSKQV